MTVVASTGTPNGPIVALSGSQIKAPGLPAGYLLPAKTPCVNKITAGLVFAGIFHCLLCPWIMSDPLGLGGGRQ